MEVWLGSFGRWVVLGDEGGLFYEVRWGVVPCLLSCRAVVRFLLLVVSGVVAGVWVGWLSSRVGGGGLAGVSKEADV